ncbi:MAG: B12-binding domain-containing protein [Candidatus Eremiobacteraeota bacterium]|nr:B12-binding domain-containing protein [Candidatus Eremiobacteraeota bacterium]
MKQAVDLPRDIHDEVMSAFASSIELQTPELFVETIRWAQSLLVFRYRAPGQLSRALESLTFQAGDLTSAADAATAREMLLRAREELSAVRLFEASLIDERTEEGAIGRRYLDALLSGDETRAGREVLLAVAYGRKSLDVYEKILTPVLHEAGRLWQRNEITISHEHLITTATERIMAQLCDLTPARPHRELSAVTVALGEGRHELGARMAADAFSMCGWHSSFLGGGIPVNDVARYLEGVSVDVIGCSASRPRDVLAIRDLIEEFETKPIAPLVLVGGSVFDHHPQLWRRIAADGYAPTPLMGVALANELISDCCES